MKYLTLEYPGAEVSLAIFDHGRREVHAMIHTTLKGHPFAEQLLSITSAAASLEEEYGGAGRDSVFRRYFLSDATNQAPMLPQSDCAVSVVQQPPLDGTKAALWLLFQYDGHGEDMGNGIRRDRHGIVWVGDHRDTPEISISTPHLLTFNYLENFAEALRGLGGGLKQNCVRTWFFVRDVDVNYAGVVEGRNQMFEHAGLSADTHFIASTGIEGRSPHPKVSVSFNAYADTRIDDSQMTFLKGATHLNPTIEYGVAFERGTAVDYADRRQVFISGTASIDNHGQIFAPGDIMAQTDRMLENIGVLLEEAECDFKDVAHMIVYLRDAADYEVVSAIFRERFPDVPCVIVLAPVCRPGWLIETECMAIRKINRPERIPF